MKDDQHKPAPESGKKEPNVLPATEIPVNPNPRANANLSDKEELKDSKNRISGVGSEITDGEAG